ncbi:molybdopterin-dependent oxidoreductase [Sulfurihydrogenibium azorense]|uniref:molybdopterin-dependent oxidoreductase n=1 Tax=Sulfurihydrogenibium azorense TaxID=309806 RepID=UPI00391C6843
MGLSRRDFLKTGSLLLASLSVPSFAQRVFEPAIVVENPLAYYPNRNWENFYRDIYNAESKFVFLCNPNDTHGCLLNAYVKNGVITRIEPTYKYGLATDIYGTKVSHRWEPRCCNKGLALVRRFYGDRRVKGPFVRKGYYEWYKAGFPRDEKTGEPPQKYFQRGKDKWLRVSWDEIADIIAKSMINIAQTYSGEEGRKKLENQGHYTKEQLDVMNGAGTRTLKFRGSMPFLAVLRYPGIYRMANMMALLDQYIRNVPPEKAAGGTGWDNYSEHTDLPPGHPMVTGQQTVDFDLALWEHSRLIILWGMNPYGTKMPDSHWLTEAQIKGTKVVVISNDFMASARTADKVIIVRSGTDGALALSLSYVIMKNKWYKEKYIKSFTDMPLLVRMDNGKILRARDIIPDYIPKALTKTVVYKPGEKLLPNFKQDKQVISQDLRIKDIDDYVVWDLKTKSYKVISRDDVGEDFLKLGIDPALDGKYVVKTVDGKEIEVRPLFSVYEEFLGENYTPEIVEKITGVPAKAIIDLAKDIAENAGQTKIAAGMGVNQYLHGDLTQRAMFILAALTENIGKVSGNIGSYAGNYRLALFDDIPQWNFEDPFNIETDPNKPANVKPYWRGESQHYWADEDTPLYVGNTLITGKTHIPVPTKFIWFVNNNSGLGNQKWAYNVIMNQLPKTECIINNDWWWTLTCEYSDIVLGVDAWHENRYWDLTGSVTNPFIHVWPKTGHKRYFDTKNDLETYALVAEKLAYLTGDKRFSDYWKFIREGKTEVYLQRIINASSTLRGYKIEEIAKKAQEGIPSLILTRSYPKFVGHAQTSENKPWYTKSGRLEFYREEDEFINAGENLPVYREPVDATKYQPNVIVAKPHPLIRLKKPSDYGITDEEALKITKYRQARNVLITADELIKTRHPLIDSFGATHIIHTPKFRHTAHSATGDVDIVALLFGPYGDFYRHNKRMPYVTEAYIEINTEDLEKLGLNDGDYVYVDADPQDRPFIGWQKRPEDYEVARALLRVRASYSTPKGVGKIWFNMYGASHGSVKGTKVNRNGLAKNPETGYQSFYRRGSQQSVTRGWLKPTLMTDSLIRKDLIGQNIGKGFMLDVHCPVGAPREAFGKITKAENGGFGNRGVWRPLELGLRPQRPRESFKKYLKAVYVKIA